MVRSVSECSSPRTRFWASSVVLARAERFLEMLARLRIVDGELQCALDHRVEAVDQHARLEHPVALAVVDVAGGRRRGLDQHDIGRHEQV